MKLVVKDLAHIKSASINDESDLTIIVGDNGSGKTLLLETYTLLSEEILKYRTNLINNLMEEFIDNFKITLDKKSMSILSEIFLFQQNILEETSEVGISRTSFREVLIEKINSMLPDSNGTIDLEAIIEISDVENINRALERNIKITKDKFISLAELKVLYNYGKIGDINFIHKIPNIEKVYNQKVKVSVGPNLWSIDRRFFIPLTQTNSQVYSFELMEKRIISRVLSIFMSSLIGNDIIDISNSDVLLIPTERNSIIANSNLRTRKELENNGAFSRYSEFAFTMEFLKFKEELGQRDFSFFENIDEDYKQQSINFNSNRDFFFNDIDSNSDSTSKNTVDNLNEEVLGNGSLEKITKKQSPKLTEMLGGNLVYNKFGELNSLVDLDGNEVNSRLFSTKQNHISSFAIVEENLNDYDVVIIEEPEANLSLKAIKQLVDYLIDLIENHNIKLILTTHNELFFQRLNNKLLQNKQISSSVYEFLCVNGKSELMEIEKSDYGYSVELFNSELNQIFQETVDIQNSQNEEEV